METLDIVTPMWGGTEALSIEIHAAILRARTAWPLIALDEAGFVRRLLEILGEQPAAAVADLHVEDLYLASACIEGHEDALMMFDARMLPVVETALARARIEPGMRDDLVQELRIHLLVGAGGGPGKLAQYRGQAEIERWLRATALRAAYRVASKSRRYVAFEDAATAASVLDEDPVLAQWKERCCGELKRAFTAALAALPRRDRLLLKQHYLDRLTIEDVAALHKIHRSSAARWLAQARAALADAVLDDFRRRLRVSETEVQSIVQLVRSQLDITLDRFLSAR